MTRQRQRPMAKTFVPRATLTILGGLLLFVVVSLGYALPALLEEPPPRAIEDYRAERVRQRLEGKVMYLFAGSVVVAALLGSFVGRDSR